MKYFKEIVPYIVIIILIVLIRTFIVTPVRVTGESMDETLKDGQVLILNKTVKNYERFDIVVIKYGNEKIIKRVIGLPRERISYSDNKLFVNGKTVKESFNHGKTNDFSIKDVTNGENEKIPDGYYLVLGDNRPNSYDSRQIGLIKKENIIGKVDLRIYPLNKIQKI